ncbi:hypothetical protein LN042_19110 [Kitasatospora sp. RB6PN24]|uniref:hypothetical protein n=1 Tax=Kitasatospora humi TaxID=2893891 RepID=UPI001E4E2850|nr:hypothetical protein [Kitasatospora humi]MCC9309167.1 hypothetical protein [Kitasatospora humi]
MPEQPRARPLHAGARIRLHAGRAHLFPAVAVPEGMVAGQYSVLSPGTERRHLAGSDRDAGYMTLGQADSAWLLAPVPHGAAFDPQHHGAVIAPAGTGVEVAALARFQQMALLGLDRVPGVELDGAIVVGSGPVALGCVLELHRRGVTNVRVVTSRRHAPIGRAPGVTCVVPGTPVAARLVIDAAGDPRHAAALTEPGGVLGLLGTPEPTASLSAIEVHRAGWTVVGMHELAAQEAAAYRDAYSTAAAFLTERLPAELLPSWCRTVSGTRAPELYALLTGPGRPAEPVIVFDWRTA